MPTLEELINETSSLDNIRLSNPDNVFEDFDFGFENTSFESTLRVNQLVRKKYNNKPFYKEKGFGIYTSNNTNLLFSDNEPEEETVNLPEVVVTASKKYRRSLMEFEDFDLFLFTSTDGAALLKEHKNLHVDRNEIAIFLEIDNKTNFFGGVMRIKVGSGIRTNTDLPYHEIINLAHNKKIDISPKKIKKILKKGAKSKKTFFKWVLSNIANVAEKVVKFVTKGVGDLFFNTIPHAINHIKAKEKHWNPKAKGYDPILIPKGLENYLEKLKKTESDDFENKVINKLIKPFFNQVDQLEKKVKTQFKAIKGFIPNKIYRKLKKAINHVFNQIKNLEEAIYNVKDAFIDLILTSLQTVNAFLCGLYNSLIDIINGIFQIIGIVFLGISGLVDFAANAGYYAALATEIIENVLESIYNTNYKELFTQFLLLPFKLSKFFYNYAKKAADITPQEVFYFLGYVVGFVIETIIGILFTGGTLTLNKVLVKTFKEPFELLLKGVKKVGQVSVSLFEKVMQFLQYVFKKLENVKELFLKFYKWLDQIILSGRASNIFEKGRRVLYIDFTLGTFQTLKLLHKKYWIYKLNKVGLQFEETNNMIKFVYKDQEIFSGTKKQAKEELLSYFKKAGRSEKKLEKYLDELAREATKRSTLIKKYNFNLKILKDEYIGEELGLGWLEGSNDKVKYLNKVERAEYKLTFKKGKLYDINGNLFDTSIANTHFSEGRAIFVMDEAGDIFASLDHTPFYFHHSSFLSGQKVASAGELKVLKGKIIEITNKSGHYWPSEQLNKQFSKRIKEEINYINEINFKIYK